MNTNQKETELDKKLKVLREDQKAFLINSIVNDEILSSIERYTWLCLIIWITSNFNFILAFNSYY